MPIRIVQIIPTLDRAGAEKQMCLLAAGLPPDQFDVHVCVLTRTGPLAETLKAAGIPVTVIGKRWKVDPLALIRLTRYLRRLAPDLVHTWLFAANAYGRQAALMAGVRRIVAGERCVDPWKSWRELQIDRYLVRRTDRIVTNSSGVRDFYVERGLPGEKFVIIPNGVSVPCTPSEGELKKDRGEFLSQLGLGPDAKLVGAVGRLWPQKRYKDLIWAAELLRVIRDDMHLVIFGDGPQRWRLERFRDQIGSRERVHFLGSRDDVARWLPQLDCYWLGSGYEGQSNALMEAMSAGLPVVATDIPGNRDLVVHEQTGFLVNVGDRAAFAHYTNRLLNDPPLARRLGAAGRERMKSDFSVAGMIQGHDALYRSLCNA